MNGQVLLPNSAMPPPAPAAQLSFSDIPVSLGVASAGPGFRDEYNAYAEDSAAGDAGNLFRDAE
jgi:hypothetical protein